MNGPTDRTDAPAKQRLGRRKWLKSLIIGGCVTVLGGAVGLVRTGGYAITPAVAARLRVLVPWQYIVVRDVARRMVAPDRSQDVPSADEVGVAEFVDAYLLDMRLALRRDFLRLLRFLEHLAPLGSGRMRRFTELSESEQDDVLVDLERSRVDQLRAGFQALKSLIMMGYYRDPRTFSILQYAGPLLAAPEDMKP